MSTCVGWTTAWGEARERDRQRAKNKTDVRSGTTGAAMRGGRRGAQSGRTGAAMRRRRIADARVRCDRGDAPVCWSACACACTVPRGSLRLRKSAAAPPHHLVTQTKRGVSLNFPDQVTSERRFGATPQSNCPYAWCSTSELMTWQKKSRGLQSTLRKTENIAPYAQTESARCVRCLLCARHSVK